VDSTPCDLYVGFRTGQSPVRNPTPAWVVSQARFSMCLSGFSFVPHSEPDLPAADISALRAVSKGQAFRPMVLSVNREKYLSKPFNFLFF
jgi:hypothetical protein